MAEAFSYREINDKEAVSLLITDLLSNNEGLEMNEVVKALYIILKSELKDGKKHLVKLNKYFEKPVKVE